MQYLLKHGQECACTISKEADLVRHVCCRISEEKNDYEVPKVPYAIMRHKYESASLLDLILVSILLKLFDEQLTSKEIDLHPQILKLVYD